MAQGAGVTLDPETIVNSAIGGAIGGLLVVFLSFVFGRAVWPRVRSIPPSLNERLLNLRAEADKMLPDLPDDGDLTPEPVMDRVRAWDARLWQLLREADRPRADVRSKALGPLPEPFTQVAIGRRYVAQRVTMIDDIIRNGL